MSTPQEQEIAQRAYKSRRRWLFLKEVTLLLLVAVVAGLSMYVARDNHTALGLLPGRVALADELPVITSFRTPILSSEPFLELDLREMSHVEQQVAGTVFDPTNPPPVEMLSALNSRIGGEVVLFWTLPKGVSEVAIYRTAIKDTEVVSLQKRDTKNETKIVDDLAAESYVDTDVTDGEAYQYRVVSLQTHDGKVYESEEGSVDVVIPSDEVPPQAPQNVIVRTSTVDDKTSLEVLWVHTDSEDFDHVRVYRSSIYGDRGEEVALVQANQTAAYIDDSVDPNETYYYTVVSYDTSDNASSADFQAPAPGNSSPFEPFTVNSITGEVIR